MSRGFIIVALACGCSHSASKNGGGAYLLTVSPSQLTVRQHVGGPARPS
jgi:hypothetical protein